MNILVVEDDDSVSEIIAETVRAGEHEVEISGTGKDALEKIQEDEVSKINYRTYF